MFYEQQWGGTHPGCLIFLLDQSGSMSDPFGLNQVGGGIRKCDMVATILNRFLHELIVTNIEIRDGIPQIRPRADIAVIGYNGYSVGSALGNALAYDDFVSLSDLQENPLRIEKRMKKEIDETGRIFEIPIDFPIWVNAVSGDSTPMCAALSKAFSLAQDWAGTHPDNYPPVIINVTDGMATDGDPRPIAEEICQISTRDGQALLFNVHITDLNIPPIIYPAREYKLPDDAYAHLLFSMSSVIPETSRALLSSLLGNAVELEARGLIFNGDAASIRQMFIFATVPATLSPDPNR